MAFLFLLGLLGTAIHIVASASEATTSESQMLSHQVGSARKCLAEMGEKVLRMGVLPGRGWDNLRNVEQSPVLTYNYSACQTTYDGRHLLPDSMSVVPILHSKLDTHLNIFDSSSTYKSLTAASVNAEATVYSIINGQFSSEHKSFKRRAVSQRSIVTRMEIRHLSYMIHASPSATLDATFKHRLLQIAASIQGNRTLTATYLSQLLVRDYGTHYIHTTYAGGILAKTDYISRHNSTNTELDRTAVTAGAQADFFGKVQLLLSLEFSHKDSRVDAYRKLIRSSSIETHGGPLFTTNMTVSDWEAGVKTAMVAIDYDGNPIHFLIMPDTLPEVPPALVASTASYVKAAVDKYYSVNTHPGCIDFSSPNFDYLANIDDGSCKNATQNFTFGGVYQTCETTRGVNICSRLQQKNPLTQGFSCPTGYESIRAMSGSESYTETRPNCWTTYRRCGFLWLSKCASGRACRSETHTSVATFITYWCAAAGPRTRENHYYFGGIYTSSKPNPLTGTHGCPTAFRPLRFTSKGHICVSSDNELGRARSLPFGGFHTCIVGNPFAGSSGSNSSIYPRECPTGYSQHLALVDDDCELKYCLRAGALSRIVETPIIPPPFMDTPDSFLNETNNLYFLDSDGNVWTSKNANNGGSWRIIGPESSDYEETINRINMSQPIGATSGKTPTTDNSGPLDNPLHAAIIGAAIGMGTIIILLLLLCGVCHCGVCIRKKLRRNKKKEDGLGLLTYRNTEDERVNSGELGTPQRQETLYVKMNLEEKRP